MCMCVPGCFSSSMGSPQEQVGMEPVAEAEILVSVRVTRGILFCVKEGWVLSHGQNE